MSLPYAKPCSFDQELRAMTMMTRLARVEREVRMAIKQFIVPLDGLPKNERAIGVAVALAAKADATVELVSVVSAGLEQDDLAEMDAIAAQHPGVMSTRILTDLDTVESTLLAEVAGPERLLCIASAGHGAVAELVEGSVSENIIRRSAEPVVAVGPHAEARPNASVLAVALDGSPSSEAVLPAALAIADQLGLSLMLVGVHPPLQGGQVPITPPDSYETRYLARVANQIDPTRRLVNWDVLHNDNVVDALVGYSEQDEVALMAMATHGPSYLERFFLGGITFRVIKHAKCPVLTWHEPSDPPRIITYRAAASGAKRPTGGRVVVGVDTGDPESIVRWAAHYAAFRNAELRIVHAWQIPYEVAPGEALVPIAPAEERDKRLDAIARRAAAVALAAHHDLAVEALITTTSPPAEALIHAAEGADLLVIGRHDRNLIGRLLVGSVATACVRHSPCPVVVIPEKTSLVTKENHHEGS
jgi:nucleotide-binding universal stress UspA family protein